MVGELVDGAPPTPAAAASPFSTARRVRDFVALGEGPLLLLDGIYVGAAAAASARRADTRSSVQFLRLDAGFAGRKMANNVPWYTPLSKK